MHYVVSDIHNDYQKFCELLKVIKLSKEDKLFILGDLFDRSDYNPNLVDLYFKVMELGDNCSMIRGNHDEWLAAYILSNTGVEKKKNRTISVQYISMSYPQISTGGCSESCEENFNLVTPGKYSGE